MHRPWFRYYPNLFFFTWLCLLLYSVFVSFRFCPQRMSTLHLYQLKLILICFVRSLSYILKAIFIFTITFLTDSVLNKRTEVRCPQYFWKKCLTLSPKYPSFQEYHTTPLSSLNGFSPDFTFLLFQPRILGQCLKSLFC